MPPNVSVLIPIHNAENTLKTALDSVKRQTLQEIEIICINDGSTDHSLEILRNYADDPRFKIVNLQKNQGTLFARKRGVESATGKYIMFLDADDWFELDACKIAFQKIETHQVDIFHFGTRIIPGKNISRQDRTCIRKAIRPYHGFLEEEEVFFKGFDQWPKYDCYLWNKIFSSSLCKRAYILLKEFPLNVCEDLYLYFALALLAHRYYGENIPLYNYHFAQGICSGTCQKISGKQFEQFCATPQLVTRLQKLLTNLGKTDQEHIQTLYRIHTMLFSLCRKRFQQLDFPEEWNHLFIRSWFHNDPFLYETVQTLIGRYQNSLSVKLGLILTWIPRKILALLTGRQY